MMQSRNHAGRGVISRQAGLSLVELMIASAIGLVVVMALSQLFVDVSRSNNEMAKTNSQIENARFSLQIVEQDLEHAGFWGLYVPEFDDLSFADTPTDLPAAIPDPCLAYSTANWTTAFKQQLIGVPVEVTSGAPGTCAGLIADQVAGTDVLVVRHAYTCEPGTAGCEDDGAAGRLYFQPSVCIDDTDPYLLDPNAILEDKDCTPGSFAPKRKFVQSIYYVRSWFSNTPSKDGIPTLVRSDFDLSGGALAQQPAQALVEGIEGFRVELGVDDVSEPYTGFPNGSAADPNDAVAWLDPDNWDVATNRGDGSPDGAFVHCPDAGGCTVAQLINTVAAKVYVLARTNQPTNGYTDTKTYQLGNGAALGPYNDGYKRHVFSSTVRLVNISSRRETP